MVQQNQNKTIHRLEKIAAHAGMTVMMLATMISMAEIAEREGQRIVATLQPSYAHSGQNNYLQGHGDERATRAKEEIRHTSATYGAAMRTHPVSGTL